MSRYTLEVRTGKLSGSFIAGFDGQRDAIAAMETALYALGASWEEMTNERKGAKDAFRAPGFQSYSYAPFRVEWSVKLRRHSKV